jgi:hypothetical protein
MKIEQTLTADVKHMMNIKGEILKITYGDVPTFRQKMHITQ